LEGRESEKKRCEYRQNYLTEDELAALNNLVEQYLVFAEGQAMRRIPMSMKDWIEKLNGFLNLNDRAILTHAGTISHQLAVQRAESEYEKFEKKRIHESDTSESDFDKVIKNLPVTKTKRVRKA
jgi:hypothetical protein